jgi:hypothetical protein
LAGESLAAPPQQIASDNLADDAASERARKLLAEYGIPVDEYHLIFREWTRWTDSSLGCRRPGEMYTQALVDGQTLRFSNSTKTYEVHVAGDRAVLCPLMPESGRGPLRPSLPAHDLDVMLQKARSDLAQRLAVALADVEVKKIAAAAWRDTELGCADGSTDAAGSVHGYRLFLRVRGDIYTYHTDLMQVMACPPVEAQ